MRVLDHIPLLVVLDIRKEGTRDRYYYVDFTVDGAQHEFLFDVDDEMESVRPHSKNHEYDLYIDPNPFADELVGLLLRFHRGELIDFPVDLLRYRG